MKQASQVATCHIVSDEGTDDEIAARCAEAIPDWASLSDKVKADTVRLMRVFWSMPPSPPMQVREDEHGNRSVGFPEGSNVTLNSLRLVEAFASSSQELANERIADLSRLYPNGDTSAQISAGLAFVAGAKAQDPVQSALAVQMIATHDAAMLAVRRFKTSNYAEHAKMYGTIGAKLLNAYTRQAEVLAKLQRGGEQVIKHIHIDNRGGQAVVTDQLVTGGQHAEREDQPYGQSACIPALLGKDAPGNVVPLPRDEGQEAVPVARRPVAGRA